MSALEIVLTAVLSVLVVVVLLVIVGKRLFRKLFTEKSLDFPILDEFAEPGGILFLGDSLTDFYPVQEFFRRPDVYNRGIAGDTTEDVIRRLDEAVDLAPDKVFVQIGVNDLIGRGRKVKPEELALRIVVIGESFFSREQYVLSLYPVNRKKTLLSGLICRGATNARIQAVNRVLAQRCEESGLIFLDLYSHLADQNGNLKAEYTVEGLHLNVQGYREITRVLAPYVNSDKTEAVKP